MMVVQMQGPGWVTIRLVFLPRASLFTMRAQLSPAPRMLTFLADDALAWIGREAWAFEATIKQHLVDCILTSVEEPESETILDEFWIDATQGIDPRRVNIAADSSNPIGVMRGIVRSLVWCVHLQKRSEGV